jgi:hypothetical protein
MICFPDHPEGELHFYAKRSFANVVLISNLRNDLGQRVHQKTEQV